MHPLETRLPALAPTSYRVAGVYAFMLLMHVVACVQAAFRGQDHVICQPFMLCYLHRALKMMVRKVMRKVMREKRKDMTRKQNQE